MTVDHFILSGSSFLVTLLFKVLYGRLYSEWMLQYVCLISMWSVHYGLICNFELRHVIKFNSCLAWLIHEVTRSSCYFIKAPEHHQSHLEAFDVEVSNCGINICSQWIFYCDVLFSLYCLPILKLLCKMSVLKCWKISWVSGQGHWQRCSLIHICVLARFLKESTSIQPFKLIFFTSLFQPLNRWLFMPKCLLRIIIYPLTWILCFSLFPTHWSDAESCNSSD